MKIKRIKRLIESLNENEIKELDKVLNEGKVEQIYDMFVKIIAKNGEGETAVYKSQLYYNSESKNFWIILPGFGSIESSYGYKGLEKSIKEVFEYPSYYEVEVIFPRK